MNPKGHKPNLKQADPGNRNAEKSGVHSPRRRAEETHKVQQEMAEDPQGYLDQDLRDMYAEARGFTHLVERDLAERGVSDRSGKPRRMVGTLLRSLGLCKDLNEQIQATLAAAAEHYDDSEPFSAAEGVDLIRGIAHDGRVGGSARLAAARYLLEHRLEIVAEAEFARDYAFYKELEKLTDEELQREIDRLRVPDNKRTGVEPAVAILRKLARLSEIGDEQLLELHQALTEELALDES